ncbi:MAG: hypothetical protein Tsb006_7520 [Rickettsiaceae bacterium]
MEEKKHHNNLNKTFARRIGKSLSDTDKRVLDNVLPKYLYAANNFASSTCKAKYLEIGFGMGEHFVHQVKSNPEALYIGAEVYLNGVARVLKQLQNSKDCHFMLWPDDIDLVLTKMPPSSLDGIYILFPDPWHKRKYLKKRLLNQERLESIKDKLKPGGFLSFASDIEDYFSSVIQLFEVDQDLEIATRTYLIPHSGYIQTKYHQKAIKEGRTPKFITAIRLEKPGKKYLFA